MLNIIIGCWLLSAAFVLAQVWLMPSAPADSAEESLESPPCRMPLEFLRHQQNMEMFYAYGAFILLPD